MRFSLLFLNALVAVAAFCVWSFHQHGARGLLFSVPLVIVAVSSRMLIRRNCPRWAGALLAAYFGCWGLTLASGIPAAGSEFRGRLNVPNDLHLLKADPLADPEFSIGKQEQPWCYVGNYSVPCPFVVSHDYSAMSGGFGCGERIYLLWLPGRTWIIDSELHWNACPR